MGVLHMYGTVCLDATVRIGVISWGQNIRGSAIFSQFVVKVAACTAGEGRQGRFIRGSCSKCSTTKTTNILPHEK